MNQPRPLRVGMYVHNLDKLPPEEMIMAHYTITRLLADGLSDRGHEITLFAPRGSRTKAKLVSFGRPSLYESKYRSLFVNAREPRRGEIMHFYENAFLSEMVAYVREHIDRFDVIHVHSVGHAAHLAKLFSLPTLYTVHDPVDPLLQAMVEIYMGQPNFHLIAISENQRKLASELRWLRTIPNGTDLSLFPYRAEPEEHLMFVGRMNEDKGPHRAIKAAKQAGVPLKLYGPYNSHGTYNLAYWQRKVAPLLDSSIVHEGYVTPPRLAKSYGRARALLMPIEWEEPFGLVSIEAMACGTPVIGFRRGALPEIIEDGVTGFIVDSVEEMAQAIRKIGSIDRADCRRHVEKHFSANRLVRDYEEAYYSLASGQ